MTVADPRRHRKSKIENAKIALPLTALLGGSLVFIALSTDVHFHGLLSRVDEPLRAFLHNHSQPLAIILCSGLSFLGEFGVLFPIAFFVAGYLFALRLRAHILLWIIRPPRLRRHERSSQTPLQSPTPHRYTYYVWDMTKDPGYSFPSGHTMGVAITAGTLYLLARHLQPDPAQLLKLATTAAIALPLAVAAALMYVGVHSLTDVLAALTLSLAWLGLVALALRRIEPVSPFAHALIRADSSFA